MRRSFILFLAFALTVAFVIGCSGGGGDEVTLPAVEKSAEKESIGTHLWGIHQVVIDKNTQNVDIVQLRGADQILNVIGFLEPPVLGNMSIDFDTLIIDPVNNLIEVDVILKHPIPDPVFMGFDVRGICIGPDVTNADGVTVVMNPADFEGEAFGYVDGLLGAPNSYASYDGVWGYKYFCDDLGLNDSVSEFFSDEANLANRGVFSDGSTNTRHYNLSWVGKVTPIDFLVFNYAIYANYDWPLQNPPTVNDFNITANSSEAFCFSVAEISNTMSFSGGVGGGDLSLQIEVWDWQGAASQEVTIESVVAGIAETASDNDYAGSTSKSWVFEVNNAAANPTSIGMVDVLIKAVDPDITFGQAWFLELLNPANELYDENVWCGYIHQSEVFANQAPVVDGVYLTGPSGCGYEFTCDATDAEDATADLVFAWSVEEEGDPAVYDDTTGNTSGDTNTIILSMPGPGTWEIGCEVTDTAASSTVAPLVETVTTAGGLRLIEAPLTDGDVVQPRDIGVDPVSGGNVFILGEVTGDSVGLNSVTVWDTDMNYDTTFNNIGSGVTSGPAPSCPPSALDVAQSNYFTICWPEEDPSCTNNASHDWNFNKINGASTGVGRWWVSYLYSYDTFNNNDATSGNMGNTAAMADYPYFSGWTGLATYYHCGSPGVSQGALWQGGYPVYNVGGSNGVYFPPNVPYNRVDCAVTGVTHGYIIEGSPENSVEAWRDWDSPWLNYQSSADCQAHYSFTGEEPIDVTVDSTNRVIVLTDTVELFFFDGDLNPEDPPSLDLSGCVTDPIAVDVDLTNDEIYVLSENGVTVVIA
jgi:hypothetical protein